MIRFIGGKPGGSKSLYAMVNLVEELRRTNRFIVTNVAVEMIPWVDGGGVARKGLREGVLAKYGEDYDCERRVVLLDDEQVHRFYAVRPRLKETGDVEVITIPPSPDGRFRFSAGVEGLSGCAYFIDEAHEFFAARDWAKTGKEVLSWASQQRRAGDDAWFLTQVIGNVEKQLRGVSQECYWMTNHRLARLGMFRQPDMLSYKLFSSTPPTGNEAPLAKGRVQCDRQFIYGTYNTAKGVGVAGRQADIGVRAKGLHWSWIIGFIALASVGVMAANKGVQFGIRKGLSISVPKASGGEAAATKPNQFGLQNLMPMAPIRPPAQPVIVPTPPTPDPKSHARPPAWVVAMTTSEEPGRPGRGSIGLIMSNGFQVHGTNWQRIEQGWLVDGHIYPTQPYDSDAPEKAKKL